MNRLIAWKKDVNRKPLLLKGVRQCGKTWLLKLFGKEQYEHVAYFNFEGNAALAERFSSNLDPLRILQELSFLSRIPILPGKTLVILDEIQFCGPALTALKYFHEDAPDYHIACAGSLLGIALSKQPSFPVGKVDFMTLRPLSFSEFVMAHGDGPIMEYLLGLPTGEAWPRMYADRLSMLLKTYFVIGGMPDAVSKWLSTKDIVMTEQVQDDILDAYELDFARHAPAVDFPKLALIWHSIPNQLARENARFMFGHAKPGARAKDLEDALQWLIAAGMAHKVHKVERPGFPLSAYADPQAFKLYLSDVGLLRRLSRLPASALYEENPLFAEFKGALTENFVLTEILSVSGDLPFYWRSGNTAEVDFLLQAEHSILPMEVKASTNVRSRSLSVYREKYQPEMAVRASMNDLKQEEGLLNIPLYALWALKKHLRYDTGDALPKQPDIT